MYYYRVKAVRDGEGGVVYSRYSQTVNAVTAGQIIPSPSAPSGLSVKANSQDSILLSWTDNSDNEDGFSVERSIDGDSFVEVARLNANIFEYSDVGLDPKTLYYYRVRAYRLDGLYVAYSNYSNTDKVSTLSSLMSAPSSLSVVATSYSQLDLSWRDNSSDETGFALERSRNGVDFYQIVELPANTTFYSNTGLMADSAYYYRVRAYKDDGISVIYSSYSRMAAATTFPYSLNAPSNLNASPISYSQIDISWSDNSENETGFSIERGTDGVNFFQVGQVSSGVSTYQDKGLVPNTAYYYRVRAYSDVSGVFYFSSFAQVSSASTLASPLNAPSSLTVVASSSSEMDISWTDDSSDETGFYLERSLDNYNFYVIKDLPANTTTYSDSGLNSGTKYYYRVMAHKNGEQGEIRSAYSMVASATTISIVVAPPSGLSAKATSYSEINLSWTDNSNNETGFVVERSLNGVNFFIAAEVGYDQTSYQDQGLVSNTTYYYRVKARRLENGQSVYSVYSATVSAQTGAWTGLAAPSNLAISEISYYQAKLSWSDNSNNETAFEIEKSSDGVVFAKAAEVGEGVSSYTVLGLTSGKTYYFRVKAKSSNQSEVFYSAYSNSVSGTTLTAPFIAAPSNLTSVSQPWYQIDIYWNDNATNETGYWVEKSFDGYDFFPISYVGENGFMISDSDIEAGGTYYYRARALRVANGFTFYSEYSDPISATCVDAPPTTAPNNLAVAYSGPGRIDLAWNDTTNDEVGFFLERSDAGGGFYQLAFISPDTPTYADQSVESGVEYSYRVRMAVDSYGYYFYSGYSNTTSAVAQ